VISVVCAPVITATFGRLASLRLSTASARSSCSYSIKRHVAREAREVDRRLDAGVAAADHRDALALVQRSVAMRAIGDAAIAIFALAGHVDLAPAGAGRDHHRLGLEHAPLASRHRSARPESSAAARCKFITSTS
jgi:hypothetical protein